jgi:hypothetical protein
MSENNLKEAKVKDSSHECMDDNRKEDTRMKTEMVIVNKNTEMLIQETDERVSVNGDNKKVNDSDKQNNVSRVLQNQESSDIKNIGDVRINSIDPEVAQTSTTNTQCKILDKIVGT